MFRIPTYTGSLFAVALFSVESNDSSMLKRILDHRLFWLFALLLAAVSALGFLLTSASEYGLGFPLDDAWIHQTYARNIVELGEWSYVPGEASGGSTSPLWTILLAIGNVIRIDSKAWTYFIGIVILFLLALVGSLWLNERRSRPKGLNWLIVIVLIFEWHLTWAAVSGMETLAISLLFMFVFFQLEKKANEIFIGALVGVGLWLRPGALSLLIPIAMYGFDRHGRDLRKWSRGMAMFGIGLILLVLPYLLLNSVVAGSFWPNTFYAKQAEYAIQRETFIILRFAQQLRQPLIGVGIVLLPGILIAHLGNGSKFKVSRFGPLLWVIAYLGIYALRLPVTYQHGRYAIPIIPILLVLGIEGFLKWAELRSPVFRKRFFSRAWLILSVAILITFWVLGAKAYATDVAIIETEMVEPSKWIAKNTNEDALIAAHDIGALGYYGQREILDLAGLISPEVIPFIRDEKQLADYIEEMGANYFMTFPGPDWYPHLITIGESIYQSNGQFSPAAGGENMEIFRWP